MEEFKRRNDGAYGELVAELGELLLEGGHGGLALGNLLGRKPIGDLALLFATLGEEEASVGPQRTALKKYFSISKRGRTQGRGGEEGKRRARARGRQEGTGR